MANSLEFSRYGDPVEGRYDGYGEFLADSLPGDDDMDPAHSIPDCIDFNAALHELQNQVDPTDGALIIFTRNLLAEMAAELDHLADNNPVACELLRRYHGEAPPDSPVLHSSEIEPYDPFVTEIDDEDGL